MKTDTCLWSEDADGNYETDCEEMFTFLADGPVENKMQFCCYCGKPLTEQRYEERLNQDADHTPSVFNSGEPYA